MSASDLLLARPPAPPFPVAQSGRGAGFADAGEEGLGGFVGGIQWDELRTAVQKSATVAAG